MKEGVTQKQQDELAVEEDNYSHLMKTLTDLREAKNNKVLDYKMQKDDNSTEEVTVMNDIEKLKTQKDQLIKKQQLMEKQIEDKKTKTETLHDDLRKM